MPARGQKHTPEARERIAHGTAYGKRRERERARVRPRDLQRLRQSGTVAESLRPLLGIAEDEARELVGALGGADAITPQRRAIVEDLVATGIVLRAELARFLQTHDPEAGARVGTLAGSRRASLVALGLDRAGVLDVEDLAQAHREAERRERQAREAAQDAATEAESDAGAVPEPEDATAAERAEEPTP